MPKTNVKKFNIDGKEVRVFSSENSETLVDPTTGKKISYTNLGEQCRFSIDENGILTITKLFDPEAEQ